MTLTTRAAAFAAATLVSLPMSAHAASVDAVQMLQDFTVISLGDLDAGSESEGPVYVGGDLISNGYVVNGDDLANGTVGGVTGTLVVGGEIRGGNVTVEHGDTAAGSISSTLNNNGGGSVTTGVSVPVAGVAAAFESLSADLASLSDTGDVTIGGDSNNATITATSGGLSVLNVSQDFFENQNRSFNSLTIDAFTTLVINVSGSDINMSSNVNIESNNVLVNFYEAESLDYSKTFGLNILAPTAFITADVGGSNNSVVGASIFQRTEFRPLNGENFAGTLSSGGAGTTPVPLPAAAWLLLAGLGTLAATRRRA